MIAGGDLTAAAPEQGRADELGMLIEAMGQMRDRLRQMGGEIQSVADSLSFGARQRVKLVVRDRGRGYRTARAVLPGGRRAGGDDCQRPRGHAALSSGG